MNHKSDGDTNCNRCTRYSHEMIGKGTGGMEITAREETIKTTAFYRSAKILRRVLEI